jgi:arylsulfatase A-like enzyme
VSAERAITALTPNIDRIGNEGAIFMDYVAMQSCTSGRNAFFTGMYPLRTGMIPPQLPGSPSYLRPGTPALAKFLLDLGYNTGESGRWPTSSACRSRTTSTSTLAPRSATSGS